MAVKDYYFAFISYSHKDEAQAKWLHQQFEKYHLPAHIAEGQKDLPSELSPIFRDEDELSGGDLKNEIQQALINSNWLVIVCSPAAAKSDYVDLEIREFIDSYKQRNATKGKNETREERIARIIPIIASGKPYSPDEEEECFPPILHELRREDKERRAPNVNASDEGWERSFICAVATMLDLPFDTLWDRRTREMEKQRQALIETNNRIRRNQARFVSEKAHQLTESNDPYLAALLAVNVLPNEEDEQSFPYVVEAERALREACAHDEQQLRHRSMVWFAALSPDDTRIASACYDGSVCMWEKNTGKCLWARKEHNDSVWQVAFCPDGRRLASASCDGTIRLWDTETGKCLRRMEGHGGYIFSVSFSPDGSLLAFGSQDTLIHLWDLKTDLITSLVGHKDNVFTLCFSSDGNTLVSSSADGTARIWKRGTGLLGRNKWECKHILDRHFSVVRSACFSPDEKLIATASLDNTIRIWDAETGECRRVLNEKEMKKTEQRKLGDNVGVQYASFSPDGKKVVAAFNDTTIRVWDWSAASCVDVIASYESFAHVVCYTHDGGEIIAGVTDYNVHIHKHIKDVLLHKGSLWPKAFFVENDHKVISMVNRQVCVWDLDKCLCERVFERSMIHLQPDGQLLVLDDWYLYDCLPGYISRDFYFCDNYPLFNSPQRQLMLLEKQVITSDDGNKSTEDYNVYLYDILAGEFLQTFEGHSDYIISALFTPGGLQIITASNDNTIRIWDIRTGECLQVLKEPEICHLSIYGDAHRFISTAYHSVKVWNLSDFSCCWTITEEEEGFTSAALSPDGQRIAAVCSNTVRLWEINTEEYVMSLSFPDKEPESVSFSSDGRKLLASFKGGYIKVLDVPPLQDLIDDTLERFRNRPLTMEEKHRFYLD